MWKTPGFFVFPNELSCLFWIADHIVQGLYRECELEQCENGHRTAHMCCCSFCPILPKEIALEQDRAYFVYHHISCGSSVLYFFSSLTKKKVTCKTHHFTTVILPSLTHKWDSFMWYLECKILFGNNGMFFFLIKMVWFNRNIIISLHFNRYIYDS